MPLAIIAGLSALALEFAALAWLLHWLLAGIVGWFVVCAVTALALTATVIAWAAVGAGKHADDELDKYMASPEDLPTGAPKKHAKPSAHATPEPHAAGAAPLSLGLAHGKTSSSLRL